MPTTTLPGKMLALNEAIARRALNNTVIIMRIVGRNVKTVVQASLTAGKAVVDESRHVVTHTADTVRDGAREMVAEVEEQGARVKTVVAKETNRTVDAALRATSDKPTGQPYEQWTKAQLLERARELDIDGRNSMKKAELIDALRS